MSGSKLTEIIKERLRAIAYREFFSRRSREDYCKDLTFSRATVLRDILSFLAQDQRRLVLHALLKHAHRDAVTDWEFDICSTVSQLRHEYEGTWAFMTVKMRHYLAKLALKHSWSLQTGIEFQGYRAETSYSKLDLDNMAQDFSARIAAMQHRLSTLLIKAGCTESNHKLAIAERTFTPKDIWGSFTEWKATLESASFSWAPLKRKLLEGIRANCGAYDISPRSELLIQGEHCVLRLTLIGPSKVGQFGYHYDVIGQESKPLVRASYESLLGWGGGVWDGILPTNGEEFCRQFELIDKVMRAVLF
jgi:hypothetical protein